MKDFYPTGKADLMTAFMIRAQTLTARLGSWAMINLPSWMSLKSFEDLRHDLLRDQRIISMVHLGRGVFGSDFGTVAFVVANAVAPPTSRGVYRRLFEQHVQVRSVATIESLFLDGAYNRFEVSQSDFTEIPGSPIVYWLSEKIKATFSTGKPLDETSTPLVGLRTGDNARFMRQWWEVSDDRSAFNCDSLKAAEATEARWFPYNKGGAFRRWYGNHEFVVNWEYDGKEIEEGLAERYPYLVPTGKTLVRGQGRNQYFSPSVSWSDISSGAPSFRRFPTGFIHGNKGNSLFGTSTLLDSLLGVMNAPCVTVILEALTPTMTASVGDVGKTPIPDTLTDLSRSTIDSLVAIAKSDWDESEISWNFSSNPLIRPGQAQCSEML
ncbi:MAG: hypothetical protein LBL92_06060 [Propionibacteriaceae bacterium]|jgi:hypothetical protein|nr:hypothetical protein [Propionibacteriaceae bacterium]